MAATISAIKDSMIVKPDCADGSEGCGNEGAPLLVRQGSVKLVFLLVQALFVTTGLGSKSIKASSAVRYSSVGHLSAVGTFFAGTA
jgi:hypothetical protein